MSKNYSQTPDAATGKTAINIVGSAVVNGDVIPIFTHNPNTIREMLETMCDMCINCVKNGNVAYVYDRFSVAEFSFGVGISLHCIDGDTSASLYIHSNMESDFGGVRALWGDAIRSYLLKRGVMRNNGFAKRVKKCEITPHEARVLTAGFFEGNLGVDYMN
jgi:hypothetical protein